MQTARPTLAERLGPERTPRPFIKWVGGKTQLLPELLSRIPENFGHYHEPFIGGGAFFFSLSRTRVLEDRDVFLSDINRELIDTYRAVKTRVRTVIKELSKHPHEKEHFYRLRAQDPFELGLAERAARMIYLNRTGFNGLYRVNQRGEFNVPFGKYKNPLICDEDNLQVASKALGRAALSCDPFTTVLERARPGDFVYFDPPYVPVSSTANFVSYSQNRFGLEEQERLAATFEELSARGVYVMLSNSEASWVKKRYQKHYVARVEARRAVNCNAEKRGTVGEVIVTSYDPSRMKSVANR